MSEFRPWVGSLRTNRRLSVVDCSRRHGETPFFFNVDDWNYEPPPDERSRAVWAHIDRAFAEPMTRSDEEAGYASTQILAELFKSAGFDGVIYKSTFGEDGFNLALFDLDVADLVSCGLFEAEAIQAKFKQADDFYHVPTSKAV